METIKKRITWSKTVKIITISTTVLLIIAEYMLLTAPTVNGSLAIYIPAIIALIILISGSQTPRSITLTDSRLVLQKLYGQIILPYNQIEEIKPFGFKHPIRVFGSGGFCGYIGLFHKRGFGFFTSFVGNESQTFYIRMKSGKKYVFSCEDYESIIEKIAEKA